MEVLYQRYFLRMNQNNMTSLLILLILIATTMIVVNYAISSADSIMQVYYYSIYPSIGCLLNNLFFLKCRHFSDSPAISMGDHVV